MKSIIQNTTVSLRCAGLMAAHSACKKKEVSPAGVGKISFVTGKVAVDGKDVKAGDPVAPGAAIKSGKGAACEIIFQEKNIIKIMEEGDITLNITDELRVVEMRAGALGNVLRKLTKLSKAENPLFQIRTPTTVASVRGTVFFVKMESPEKTYICDCDGVVEISDPEGAQTQKVEAAHHAGFRYYRDGGKIVVRKAGLLYHDDKGVEALAAKIGETIDWKKVER